MRTPPDMPRRRKTRDLGIAAILGLGVLLLVLGLGWLCLLATILVWVLAAFGVQIPWVVGFGIVVLVSAVGAMFNRGAHR